MARLKDIFLRSALRHGVDPDVELARGGVPTYSGYPGQVFPPDSLFIYDGAGSAFYYTSTGFTSTGDFTADDGSDFFGALLRPVRPYYSEVYYEVGDIIARFGETYIVNQRFLSTTDFVDDQDSGNLESLSAQSGTPVYADGLVVPAGGFVFYRQEDGNLYATFNGGTCTGDWAADTDAFLDPLTVLGPIPNDLTLVSLSVTGRVDLATGVGLSSFVTIANSNITADSASDTVKLGKNGGSLAFYGSSPIPRQTLDPATCTAEDIANALINLNLVAGPD